MGRASLAVLGDHTRVLLVAVRRLLRPDSLADVSGLRSRSAARGRLDTQRHSDGIRMTVPHRRLRAKARTSGGAQLVELRATVAIGDAPLRRDPPAPLETVERRVQRPLLDQEDRAGRVLDPLAHAIAMHRAPAQRLEDEQVERAAQQVGFGVGHGRFPCDTRDRTCIALVTQGSRCGGGPGRLALQQVGERAHLMRRRPLGHAARPDERVSAQRAAGSSLSPAGKIGRTAALASDHEVPLLSGSGGGSSLATVTAARPARAPSRAVPSRTEHDTDAGGRARSDCAPRRAAHPPTGASRLIEVADHVQMRALIERALDFSRQRDVLDDELRELETILRELGATRSSTRCPSSAYCAASSSTDCLPLGEHAAEPRDDEVAQLFGDLVHGEESSCRRSRGRTAAGPARAPRTCRRRASAPARARDRARSPGSTFPICDS